MTTEQVVALHRHLIANAELREKICRDVSPSEHVKRDRTAAVAASYRFAAKAVYNMGTTFDRAAIDGKAGPEAGDSEAQAVPLEMTLERVCEIATRLEREATAEAKPEAASSIERPAHYAGMSIQPFDASRAWGLGLALGSAVKYIARHQHKGDPVGDLRKAIACVQDEIEAIEYGGAK